MKSRTTSAADPKRQRALSLLLAGLTYSQVAEALDIARYTLYTWRQDPEFQEALAAKQAEVDDEVHHVLVSGAVDIALTLRGLALDGQEDGRTRVQAAKLYFELLGRHKLNPVQPGTKEGELETEEDAVKLLEEYPEHLLNEAIARKRKQREL